MTDFALNALLEFIKPASHYEDIADRVEEERAAREFEEAKDQLATLDAECAKLANDAIRAIPVYRNPLNALALKVLGLRGYKVADNSAEGRPAFSITWKNK